MLHPVHTFLTTSLLTAGLSLAAVAHAGPGLLALTQPSGHVIYIAPSAIMYGVPAALMSALTTTTADSAPWPTFAPPASCLTLSTVSYATHAVWSVEGATVLPSKGPPVPTHEVVCVVEDLVQIQQLLTE